MEKLIFPGHIGKLEYIMPALQVYVEADDWVKTADYIEREFSILKANGVESEMKDDKTDYTKDAELPRYFGFVERQTPGNVKSDCRITDLGKLFYNAVKENNQEGIDEAIMTAFETVTFGKNNDGCPGSNTRIEAPNILLISSLILDGVSRQEYAGVLYEMLNNNAPIVTALVKIKMLRDTNGSIKDKVRVDNKVIPFLVNVNFLEEEGSMIKLNEIVKQRFRDRISKLPPTNDLENSFPDTNDNAESFDNAPLQQIFYGAPGTGKSDGIKRLEKDFSEVIRTTFHPDSDYATFVGAYKPVMKKVRKCVVIGKEESEIKASVTKDDYEEKISYSFVKQAFLKAYISAWKGLNEQKNVLLVIEEINRGNCAQIFGDLFQLLDRETEGENRGYSTYPIVTDEDLREVLAEDFKDIEGIPENVKSGENLLLPPNLYIWATMNTSDQSLFPIDSAFKRRWDWVYKPIKYDNKDWKVVLADGSWCSWVELQQTLNDLIYDATESEDKMLGDWFVKAEKDVISEEVLVGKIIFYLWNDVAKVDAGKLFDLEVEKKFKKDGKENKRKVIFSDFYEVDGTINSEVVKNWLKNIGIECSDAE